MTYQRDAYRTAPQNYKEAAERYQVVLRSLILFLRHAVGGADIADTAKRWIYYGQDIAYRDGAASEEKTASMQSLTESDFRSLNYDIGALELWHAILGIASELGELIEALLPYLLEGKQINFFNAAEELGDIEWYVALAATALGQDLDELRARNILKLMRRYPEKFTERDAVERDLEAERKALEADADEFTKLTNYWGSPKGVISAESLYAPWEARGDKQVLLTLIDILAQEIEFISDEAQRKSLEQSLESLRASVERSNEG